MHTTQNIHVYILILESHCHGFIASTLFSTVFQYDINKMLVLGHQNQPVVVVSGPSHLCAGGGRGMLVVTDNIIVFINDEIS